MNKNLAHLKADHVTIRGLCKAFPKNKPYAHEAARAKREVEAAEREAFCDVKEQS
jgi:hypothetical protein